MSLSIYELFYCTVNGTLLVEEQSMSVSRSTGSQPVATMAKGYAGESPGAAMCELDVKNVVPMAGYEFEASAVMAGLSPVELGMVGAGGKRLVFKGFIISDVTEQGTGKEASYDFKARGSFASWQ